MIQLMRFQVEICNSQWLRQEKNSTSLSSHVKKIKKKTNRLKWKQEGSNKDKVEPLKTGTNHREGMKPEAESLRSVNAINLSQTGEENREDPNQEQEMITADSTDSKH